uniref:Uncharacterized protein n=1 Tax=Anguilla anguilla TaxID=7936 RepID=A0A0E9T4D8_ANGAN
MELPNFGSHTLEWVVSLSPMTYPWDL